MIATAFFAEYLSEVQLRKSHMLINKPVFLGLSILQLSKLAMQELWYHYVKRKYEVKAKLCYMDTHSFIIYIKTDDIYKDIAEDFEARFDTSNYEIDKPYDKQNI